MRLLVYISVAGRARGLGRRTLTASAFVYRVRALRRNAYIYQASSPLPSSVSDEFFPDVSSLVQLLYGRCERLFVTDLCCFLV